MANPRIVAGKKGSDYVFAARGHAGDETFVIGVAQAVPPERRPRLEDRLLDEARSILRMATTEGFQWAAHGFARDAAFGVWHKNLSEVEVRRLLG